MPDSYIEECIRNGHAVLIITVNGFQLRCKVLEENDECVLVLNEGVKKIIYKHAISTIGPANVKKSIDN